MERRTFLKTAAAGAGLLCSPVYSQPLQFLMPKSDSPGLKGDEKFRLTQAVLRTLETHFGKLTLQFWNQPFSQIDFEKRLTNIVYWVDRAVREHESLYPVDPVWVMAQIMAESLFCEFAISPSLAAGICQFMPATAKGYKLIIGGSLPEHRQPPYRRPDLADSLERYNQLIFDRERYRKDTRGDAFFDTDKALQWLAEGKDGRDKALRQQQRDARLVEFSNEIRQARNDYQDYLEINITELGKRDIFGNSQFFQAFDERFTYKKPIHAMVHMLANSLRVRNGNMLAAAAAYNAGLSRTYTREALYNAYGTLPNFSETSAYLGRIIANYEEIAQRFHAG